MTGRTGVYFWLVLWKAARAVDNTTASGFFLLGREDPTPSAAWAEPIQHVAKRYKLSDVGLAKVCRQLEIPRTRSRVLGDQGSGKTLAITASTAGIVDSDVRLANLWRSVITIIGELLAPISICSLSSVCAT